MTILVFRENGWHLARGVAQSGLGVAVESYCGQTGKKVEQLPTEFFKYLCADCKTAFEDIKAKASQ